MAIYTEISFSQVQLILKDYNIGHLKKLIGIKKGIENTNYLLVTNKNKFILTIYEKRVKSKELPFFMHLMQKLNAKQINCPKPILNKKSRLSLCSQYFVLVPCCSGSSGALSGIRIMG